MRITTRRVYYGKLETYEVYLTKALEKYDTKKEEKLTRFEQFLVAGAIRNYEKAKEIVKKDELLMNMIDYSYALTHQDFTVEHYKEFEEAEYIGETRGLRKGRMEGRKAEKIETAENMLGKGFDKELVMKITKLSKQEIEKLR